MSSQPKKSVIERITINNILAMTVVGSYVGAWLFLIWYGVTTSVATGDDSLVILQLVENLKDLIITMTIITTIVIMYHFRTSPPKTS